MSDSTGLDPNGLRQILGKVVEHYGRERYGRSYGLGTANGVGESAAPCPLHDDQDPSFSINVEKGIWCCHKCERVDGEPRPTGGNAIAFIMAAESGADRAAALQILRTKFDLSLDPEEQRHFEAEEQRLAKLEKRVARAQKTLTSPKQKLIRKLRGADFTDDDIVRLRIGYERSTGAYLLPVTEYGRVSDVIEWYPDRTPKYKFADGRKRPLVGADNLHGSGPVYVVEGWFDWAAIQVAGFNAVAIESNKVSGEDLDTLTRSHADLFILLDGDDKGRAGGRKLTASLFPQGRFVELPDGRDPADLFREQGVEGFREFLDRATQDSMDALKLELRQLPEDGEGAARHVEHVLVPLLARLSGAIRDVRLTEVYDVIKRFGIQKPTLAEMVEDHRRQRIKHNGDGSDGYDGPATAAPGSEVEYTANFPDLIDLVQAKDGAAAFLVHDEGKYKVVTRSHQENGRILVPPPAESVNWMLPKASRVLAAVQEDTDKKLWDDLVQALQGVSALPDDDLWCDLLVPWVIHTHFIDRAEYSPQILLFAEPERGKTRTGKALIYCARRGIHVETLRDAHLIRFAGDFQATLFLDCRDLWKKAARAGSDDLLLLRFEKGATVPRVLWPERGPFLDTRYYAVFGAMVMATNESVGHILGTRCIRITMPEADRTFEENLREEDFLHLRERLVAMRARHFDKTWPEVEKPLPGRLGDILQPLRQIICVVRPDLEDHFLTLAQRLGSASRADKADSLSADVLRALRARVDNREVAPIEGTGDAYFVSTSSIALFLNDGLPEQRALSSQQVGTRMRALGFEPHRTSEARGWEFSLPQFKRLEWKHGLRDKAS